MATRTQIISLLLLAAASVASACGGDSKDEAPPDSGGSYGRRDSGASEEDEDAGSEESDAGSRDAGTEDTPTASESEAKAKNWVVGCYKKPKTNEELLNSCASGWRAFDESLYPASWKKDQLPSLP
jgi:hypothetical protein